MTTTRAKLPCLERVRRQLGDLEWLLFESCFDPKRWKVRLTFDEAKRRPAGELLLSRNGRKIRILSDADGASSALQGIGERHFWIDGSHWYDEHAVSILTERLGPTEEERDITRLCDLAEEVSSWVEAGDVSKLLRVVKKVRKAQCPEK